MLTNVPKSLHVCLSQLPEKEKRKHGNVDEIKWERWWWSIQGKLDHARQNHIRWHVNEKNIKTCVS